MVEVTWLWASVIALWVWSRWWRSRSRPKTAIWINEKLEENAKLSNLRFVLFAVGTRGDVQPIVALALALEQNGHSALICAPDQFSHLITSYGLQFRSCGLASLNDQDAGWLRAKTESEFLSVVAKSYLPSYVDIGRHLFECCEDFRPDCIVTGVYGLHIALDVAERCKIKVRGIKFMPEGISSHLPPFGTDPILNISWVILFYHLKRLVRMVLSARRFGFTRVQNQLRTEVLGIGRVTSERLESGGKYLPIMFAYSECIAPRAPDWPPWHKTIGFLFTPPRPQFALSDELVKFLAYDKKRPVVVTFGSMTSLQAAGCEVIQRACRACMEAGFRVVLLSSESTDLFGPDFIENPNCIVISEAPHELLFPKCSLVIHHGGAGTTARALQAGIPSIVIPILKWLDQRGWAMRLEALGCGIHIKDPFVSQNQLRESINFILAHPVKSLVFSARARYLAKRLSLEGSGAQRAVEWLLSPLHDLEYDPSSYKPVAIRRMCERSCLYTPILASSG